MNNEAIRVFEFGGFAFKDAFLLLENWENAKLNIQEYTGIDVHKKGIIAATSFNKEYTKHPNLNFVYCDAVSFLQERRSDHLLDRKIILAIRFLSAVEPGLGSAFIEAASAFMRNDDMLIFNYTIFNDEARLIGSRDGFKLEHLHAYQVVDSITEKTHIVFSKESLDIHSHATVKRLGDVHPLYKGKHLIQVFFSEKYIESILDLYDFEIEVALLQDADGLPTPKIIGQDDRYNRTLLLTRKELTD